VPIIAGGCDSIISQGIARNVPDLPACRVRAMVAENPSISTSGAHVIFLSI
jgi:hypothetical protein